ncbi:Glycerol-3-phosphate acyltransferase [Candidatus Arsenophonus lipoptenae]|uniref:Glycerol-3-phosphate acyltransferase n=1 Tax=Candidatus Arsenophonus lipoptenae TaxID=634113 RepID=A0A0X9VW13_9GAMM|nr:glycerol-3-phosphate 1-O-acyltransferase PlsB [Candidatus Arsenophonus lipoptenae]AMA65193.1 Glycerol-3-phosphate acyltransferase [Candidatus Arsenophonus lipoptenae]
MSSWHKIYYYLLNLSVKFLINSQLIPKNTINELHLDIKLPSLYILPFNSKIDLLTLRQKCRAIGLPDPMNPIMIDKIKLPSYIFIDNFTNKDLSIFRYNLSYDNNDSAKIFQSYIDLYHHHPELNIQILPVLIMFGRYPGKESDSAKTTLHLVNIIQKIFTIIWLGRDSFIRIFAPISLRKIAVKYHNDEMITTKLARIARIHYSRERLATIGPKLPVRQNLFNKLLASNLIKKAIENEAKTKKISFKKANCNAITIMKEIATDFSYEAIRLTDRLLSWIWNRLYQEINVKHIERVRKLAQNGYEIVYIPSHRSHMDYVLLSYVLYHQGLVLPHIAAGINLNFWPLGTIFRYLGAFFIRRSFKRNKLYSTIFREYLNELFDRGYPIEFFIEGGRSRTGKLLEPKTGTLSMTIQAMLRNYSRQVAIIPIYIGYEHVLEITEYTKELKGAVKEKENFLSMLKGLRKLRKLGHSYVNFSQPIILTKYLNKYVPEWRKYINKPIRPIWLNSIVNHLAQNIMIKINNAGAINGVNLCSVILLASNQHKLTREHLIEQMKCYLKLLINIPYSDDSTVPNKTAELLLEEALNLDKFKERCDFSDKIIFLPSKNVSLMTYYRNNIIHLLILPSLIANIIFYYKKLQRQEINYQVTIIYPFLKSELFMKYKIEELPKCIGMILNELHNQQLIILLSGDIVKINPNRIYSLKLLANNIKETLYRYTITLSLLNTIPEINKNFLEKKSVILAQRLSAIIHSINSPEFFDKAVFSKLINTLKQEDYINIEGNKIYKLDIKKLYLIIIKLISHKVYLTIESIKKFIHINL